MSEGACEKFVILADESAHWKIAGLTQLRRLELALGEFAETTGKLIETSVWWKSGSRTPDAASNFASARVLTTRLFLHRKGVVEFAAAVQPVRVLDFAVTWVALQGEFKIACGASKRERSWRLLRDSTEIASVEREFLRQMSKPQDGFVSRWINRPLTWPLTRLLLKLPITPTAWTLSIFALPIISALFLVRGDYVSVLIGTGIYQLYSMLDGCDGEIARSKFLESKRGGLVDDLCDIAGALLFVVSLGLGLSRSQNSGSHAWIYAAESILLAILIAGNEWALRRSQMELEPEKDAEIFVPAAYARHRNLIQRAGASRLGEPAVWFALQLTKRDVGILFFVLLALAGWPGWILHPWLLVALATVALNLISQRRTRA